MKRFLLCAFIYTIFLCIPIKADTPEVYYKIYADSNHNEVFEVKEEMESILNYICNYVDEDSYKTIVKEKVEAFEQIQDVKATFRKNTLYLTIGDGQGKMINGTYEKENICYEDVKPKSKIMEMFGFE